MAYKEGPAMPSGFTLPAVALIPPDRAEEHEMPECEFCGELIDPEYGCACGAIDAAIYDELEKDCE